MPADHHVQNALIADVLRQRWPALNFSVDTTRIEWIAGPSVAAVTGAVSTVSSASIRPDSDTRFVRHPALPHVVSALHDSWRYEVVNELDDHPTSLEVRSARRAEAVLPGFPEPPESDHMYLLAVCETAGITSDFYENQALLGFVGPLYQQLARALIESGHALAAACDYEV
jgi:hypothetical protein